MNSEESSLAGHASHGLGVLLRTKGLLPEAAKLQATSYAIEQSALGADHPDAVEARAELAYLRRRKKGWPMPPAITRRWWRSPGATRSASASR